MGPYRFPTSLPQSLPEMWERLREYVRQTEPVVLENIKIETTETIVPHGLGEVPGWVSPDFTHCRAIVKQTRKADNRRLYLVATNECVINILLLRARPAIVPGAIPNGGYKLPDWDPQTDGLGDHMVSTDAIDEAGSGYDYLFAKHSNNGNVQFSIDTTEGERRVRADYTPPTVPEVGDTIENNLYTAKVDNDLDCGQAACCFLGPHAAGGNTPLLEGWTELGDGLYQYPIAGPIPSYWLDGVNCDAYNVSGVSSMLGKTVFVYYQGDTSVTGYEEPRQGPYVLDDVGGHWENYGTSSARFVSTYPTLRRHPSFNASADFEQGQAWQMQTGNVYGTTWLELTTATPLTLDTTFLTFDEEATNPNLPTYELLTAAQIGEASTETVEASVTFKDTDGEQTLLITAVDTTTFETRSGTPGVATIDAGKFLAQAMAKVSSTYYGGDTTLNFNLYKHIGASSSLIQTLTTTPVSTTEYVLKEISASIAEEDISGATLILTLTAETTSTVDITLYVTVNDPGRTCRITLPVDLPATVTADHRHQWDSIDPVGIATHPMLPLTIATGGKLTLGDGNHFYVNPNGNSLTQITPPSCDAYETIQVTLVFTAAVQIDHETVPDSGFANIFVGAAPNAPLYLGAAYSSIQMVYLGGQWIIISQRSTA